MNIKHTGTTPPKEPIVGQFWVDPFTQGVYLWNGEKWIYYASINDKKDIPISKDEKWKKIMGDY